MTAKDYLRQARNLDRRIDAKLGQITRLRALAESVTTNLSGLPKGKRGGSRIEYCVERIMELEREVTNDIDNLVDTKREIQQAIERLDDDRHRLILEARYLCGYAWQDIADMMKYDRRQVTRIHGIALIKMSQNVPSKCDIV